MCWRYGYIPDVCLFYVAWGPLMQLVVGTRLLDYIFLLFYLCVDRDNIILRLTDGRTNRPEPFIVELGIHEKVSFRKQTEVGAYQI